jgi:hemolysin activation/secretion protein
LKKLEDNKKKQALEEEKASKKAPKKSTKKPVEAVAEAVQEAVAVPEEKATKVTVTRITIGDMKYLKSNTNVLYNETTREEVGLYDADTNTIKPLPEDNDAEMTEDEYYESDNDRY